MGNLKIGELGDLENGELEELSVTKPRKYSKTGLKTSDPKKYAREYYRKFLVGKPGRKRHGGKRK